MERFGSIMNEIFQNIVVTADCSENRVNRRSAVLSEDLSASPASD